MGASRAQAATVLAMTGRPAFVNHAIDMPKAIDSSSIHAPPFSRLTDAVVRSMGATDVKRYLDAHPSTLVPRRTVESSCDGDSVRRLFASPQYERRVCDTRWRGDRASTTPRSSALSLSAHHMCGGCVGALRDCVAGVLRGRDVVPEEDAAELLEQAARFCCARAFVVIDDLAASGGVTIDPLRALDIIARSYAAHWPNGLALVEWFYQESIMGRPLRPLTVLDSSNCPLLDHEACVDPHVDLSLLGYACARLPTSSEAVALLFGRIAKQARRSLNVAPEDAQWCAERYAWLDAAMIFVDNANAATGGRLICSIDFGALLLHRRPSTSLCSRHRQMAAGDRLFDDFVAGRLAQKGERGARWRRVFWSIQK